MKNTLKYILAAIFIITLWSCEKEKFPQLEPHTEIHNGYFVSTFYTDIRWEVDNPGKFTVKLIGEESPTVLDLATSCEFTESYMKVSITVPAEIYLKDGYYILISHHFLGDVTKRYRVHIEGGKIGTIDDVDVVLGSATQIAGAETTADASDDVWASLNKVGESLVVAWGRSETELGSALDAFKADSTLTLGESVVASSESLGDAALDNDFSKKNGGTLA